MSKLSFATRFAMNLGSFVFSVLMIFLSLSSIWLVGTQFNPQRILGPAVAVSEAQPEDLVWVRGELSTQEDLVEDLVLKLDDPLAYKRTVEMYAWDETVITKTDADDDEEKYEYRYEKVWTENPDYSGNFHDTSKVNPDMNTHLKREARPQLAQLGDYQVNLPDWKLPYEFLPVTEELLQDDFARQTVVEGIIYDHPRAGVSPEIGDHRVKYEVVPQGLTWTAFGYLQEGILSPVPGSQLMPVNRFFAGDHEEAIQQLEREYTGAQTGFRVLSFFLLFLALSFFVPVLNDLFPVHDLLKSRRFVKHLVVLFLCWPIYSLSLFLWRISPEWPILAVYGTGLVLILMAAFAVISQQISMLATDIRREESDVL